MGTPPPHPSSSRRRIGDVLVEQRLLTPEQLTQALAAQQVVEPGQRRRRLGAVIISLGMATEHQVAQALAEALGLELLDLRRTLVSPEQVRALPRAVAERSAVLVLEREGGRLKVAAADPTNVVTLDDVRFHTGATNLHVVVATESQIREQLTRAWALTEDDGQLGVVLDKADEDDVPEDMSAQAVESAPVVRMVDVVLADAVRARASDIHVEPQVGELRIRYRVDGLLRDVMTVPSHASAAIVSRIKIVSGLDISERRRPQDGRAKLTVDGRAVEARISTLPTVHGEKVVVRLLPGAERVSSLADSGMTEDQQELLSKTLAQSQGLVLITGPTGSGKTSTLYAAIQEISTPDRNVVTLEDPVEVQVAGITQVQVNERAGVTFARGLRSVLRQDPDVVLVGEARDAETADLALNASLTGHLVLTTLHTNDAVSALTRLVEMGVEPYLVASSLSLVVAQRLLRRPCRGCAVPYLPSAATLALLGLIEADLEGTTPQRGGGCQECAGTGYRGRIGVFEMLPVTAAMRQVLLTSPDEGSLSSAAHEMGMTTLRASALRAASLGHTDYEEVLRATHVDAVTVARCKSCERPLTDDMAFCPWDATPVDQGRCTACERKLDSGWHVCPSCRTAVPTEVIIPIQRSVPTVAPLLTEHTAT
jgi:type IV pilus assembly protein PilB